jgi:hypothetical protein
MSISDKEVNVHTCFQSWRIKTPRAQVVTSGEGPINGSNWDGSTGEAQVVPSPGSEMGPEVLFWTLKSGLLLLHALRAGRFKRT